MFARFHLSRAALSRIMEEHMHELALLLGDIIETMRDGGTFIEMSNCDPDSGLPSVEAKLERALDMVNQQNGPIGSTQLQ